MKTAALARCWTFVSSKGDKRYQTLLYADGSTSCDCPGWCRRVAADGSRSCKHTRAVLMGAADRECESMHDYRVAVSRPIAAAMPAAKAIEHFGQIGRRKIQT
ncbi:MAG: hypothetical protein QOE70_1614 [Chthoniobacter sp.]|jgi:hypothetical protein|nr:hypothetical protein [Chthoniobacter sp.]